MKGPKLLTVVIKLGTSSIVDEKTHEPLLPVLSLIVDTVVKLKRDGHRVILVSSGAIGVALRMLDLERRPKHLHAVQALAALGQCRLMGMWDRLFSMYRQPVAQVLLNRNDIADRSQYLNAKGTILELLNMGVIPIINENDTLSVAEIKFGDNDTLSAVAAGLVQADYLFLMTDVDCLYTTNPRLDPNASPIEVVADLSALEADVSSAGSSVGTGGMSTKIIAANLATSAGVTTIITKSSKPGNVFEIVNYLQALREAEPSPPGPSDDTTSTTSTTAATTNSIPATPLTSTSTSTSTLPIHQSLPLAPLHTRFLPSLSPIRDRTFWIHHGLAPRGTIYIDQGAHQALSSKAGLLPIGIVDVEGRFQQHEAVRLVVVRRLQGPSLYSGANTPALVSRPGSGVWASGGNGSTGGGEVGVGMGISGVSTLREGQGGMSEHKPFGLAGYEASFEAEDPLAASHASITPAGEHQDLAASQDIGSRDLVGGGAGSLYAKEDPAPKEVGRALVNYSAIEVARIKGLRSGEIANVLGYADSEYVALRENISLVDKGRRGDGEALGKEGKRHSRVKMGSLRDFA
ncbi:MAG: hypothetical protein MMC23_007014 [Stictis urceolatum]|nr:hypothetical protein [Stictis urceolata]